MKETLREASVDAKVAGYDADVHAHVEDDRTTLDFSATALAQDVADDKKDLAVLKDTSAKVGEVL